MSVKVRRANRSNPINNKIIEPLKDDAFVVGPGQMGASLTQSVVNGVKKSSRKKRKRADSQSDYQSLDEMITDPNLSINYGTSDGPINDNETGVPSTNSLVNILVQGLQSQQENMINTVLDRNDSNLMRDTIRSLPNNMVEELLKRLHKLFFSKGDKLIIYSNWLKTLLQEKLSVILMSKSAQKEIASLKHLFAARCDIFDRICALKGKLSLVSCLMEPTLKDKEMNVPINYEESSSEEEDDDDDEADEEDNSSGDNDLERIVVMDLSDTENDLAIGGYDDDDDDEDDADEDESTEKSRRKRKNANYDEEMEDGEESGEADEEYESDEDD